MPFSIPEGAAGEVHDFLQTTSSLHASWLAKLHGLAELSFNEVQTSAFIARTLAQYCPSLSVTHGLLPGLPTAVIAVYHHEDAHTCAGKPILLRADIDALPVKPSHDTPRINRDVHHACGHDGHAASLLACAHYLHECAPKCRKIILLWQPAEESGGGARILLEECRLFDTLHADCEAVFALHSWPTKPLGFIYTGEGPNMAESGTFLIEITGSG
jgi:amidohydrolase